MHSIEAFIWEKAIPFLAIVCLSVGIGMALAPVCEARASATPVKRQLTRFFANQARAQGGRVFVRDCFQRRDRVHSCAVGLTNPHTATICEFRARVTPRGQVSISRPDCYQAGA